MKSKLRTGIVVFILIACIVDAFALQITSTSPSGLLEYSPLNITVTTDTNSSCKYDTIDTSYANMSFLFAGTQTFHYSERNLEDDQHTFYARCNSGNQTTNSSTITFSIDTSPPKVLSYTPDYVTGYTYVLEITTDEDASCRYSTSALVNYSKMSYVFDTTGNTVHKETFSNIGEQTYHYFIRCKDTSGNIAQSDYEAVVEADVPPSAQIFLSDPSPVKPGTVDITVVTSEDIQDAPTLSYTLLGASGSSTTIYVPLSGFGRTYTGYMLIAETADKKVGSFTFSAEDLNGNTGSLITLGKTFLVDSSSPPKVDFLKATSESDGDIKLRWYLDDEDEHDIHWYRIYRAEAEGVTNLDFLDDTADSSYIDTDTIVNTKYYYKVSAVDSAGNEGPMSAEVSAISEDQFYIPPEQISTDTSSTTYKLTNNLIQVVDEYKEEVNGLLFEVKELALELDDNELQKTFLFSKRYANAESSLNSYLKELENLKLRSMTNTEFDFEMKKIALKVDALKKEIPLSIEIKQSDSFSLTATEEDMQDAIQNIFNLLRIAGISDEKRTEYSMKNDEIMSGFTIEPKYSHIEIANYDGSRQKYTLIEKRISGTEEKTDLHLIETIPKSFAEDINEITFVDGKNDVIKRDPVVRYKMVGLQKISYYVLGFKEMTELIESKSIIVTDPEIFFYGKPIDQEEVVQQEPEEETNLITGKLIPFITNNPIVSKSGMVFGFIVIAGLLVYYFFVMGKEPLPIPTQEDKKYLKNVFESLAPKPKQPVSPPEHHTGYLYQNYAVNEYDKAGLKTLKDIDAHVLLNKANHHIDNMHFDTANKIYFMILSQYNNFMSSLQKEEQQNLQRKINLLYQKLCLYVKSHQAKTCMLKTDYVNLSYLLNQMAEHYNHIAQESIESSHLLDYSRKMHSEYSAKLISMKSL